MALFAVAGWDSSVWRAANRGAALGSIQFRREIAWLRVARPSGEFVNSLRGISYGSNRVGCRHSLRYWPRRLGGLDPSSIRAQTGGRSCAAGPGNIGIFSGS